MEKTNLINMDKTQIGNSTIHNQRRERENALKVLAVAKSQNRPVRFLKQGETLNQNKGT